MFNETSYTLGDTDVWMQLGYPTKAAWKQAGKPALGGGTFTPPPGLPIGHSQVPTPIGGSAGGGTVPAAGGTAAPVPASSGGIGDLLSGIPSSYLMIGAAIVLLMVLKK